MTFSQFAQWLSQVHWWWPLVAVAAVVVGVKIFDLWLVYTRRFVLRKKSPLSLAEQYGLAIGGHLTAFNRMPLNDWRKISVSRSSSRDLLRDYWGISNRADALETLEMLINRARKQKRREVEDEALGYFLFLRRPVSERMDLAAWDLGRIVNVARWSHNLDYMDFDEMKSYVLDAAREAQRRYPSWEEYSLAYLVGRYEWGGEDMQDLMLDIHKMLLTRPNSPWRLLAWNTPLGS